MTASINYATPDDLDAVLQYEQHLSPEHLREKIERDEILVSHLDSKVVGYVRFAYFWSKIPIIEIIWVEESRRRRGIGREFIKFLEGICRERNSPILLSSSQADEPAPQAWHRHMGFKDSGVLVNLEPFQDVAEVIFVKKVGK